jgi:ABC-type glycerol-3-phosphate transport system substrate-binding protein
MGYQFNIDASRFANWTFAFGGDVFDDENTRYSYNDEAAVAAMTFLQELYDEGCAGLVAERFGDQTDFSQGALLFTIGSTAGLPFYQSAVAESADFNWSIAPLPHTAAEPTPNIYGTSLSMPKGTPESELATWLFIKYFAGSEVQAQWVQNSNYLPVRTNVAGDLADYLAVNPAYATAFEMLPYGLSEPSVPGYDFVSDMVEEAIVAILTGEKVRPILDQLNEDANVYLAEQTGQ